MTEDIISQVLSLHDRWNGMKGRARQKGRTVATEWQGSVGRENFVRWSLENGYHKDLVLDRRKNELGYSPDNCQWITGFENTAKEHRKHLIDGVAYNMPEIIRAGLCHESVTLPTLKARLASGWSLDEARSRPSNQGNAWARGSR